VDTGPNNQKGFTKLTAGVTQAKSAIAAPMVVGRKGEYYQLLYDMLNKGFEKAIVDGEEKSLRSRIELKKNFKHDIDIVVDEIFVSEFKDDQKAARERASVKPSSAHCLNLKVWYALLTRLGSRTSCRRNSCARTTVFLSRKSSRAFFLSIRRMAHARPVTVSVPNSFGAMSHARRVQGARLRQEALHVFVSSKKVDRKNIVELTSMSITDAMAFFNTIDFTEKEREISKVIVKEITSRLQFMLNVGIEYLTLDRKASTLSGGEAQRIRLASQLAVRPRGALFMFSTSRR
jgi:excinuclease UvrABC ATPase subunit